MAERNPSDRDTATRDGEAATRGESTGSAGQLWVCLTCEVQWDKNRRKMKLCPCCDCMGVLKECL